MLRRLSRWECCLTHPPWRLMHYECCLTHTGQRLIYWDCCLMHPMQTDKLKIAAQYSHIEDRWIVWGPVVDGGKEEIPGSESQPSQLPGQRHHRTVTTSPSCPSDNNEHWLGHVCFIERRRQLLLHIQSLKHTHVHQLLNTGTQDWRNPLGTSLVLDSHLNISLWLNLGWDTMVITSLDN